MNVLTPNPNRPQELLSSSRQVLQLESLSANARTIIGEYAYRRGIQEAGIPDYVRSDFDPFSRDLAEVQSAVDCLVRAIKSRRRLLIFGDYDADGICATALMLQFFHQCTGLSPAWELPNRLHDSYGLTSKKATELMTRHNPDLLLVLDSGTNAFEGIQSLKENGVDVLVVDHHPVQSKAPSAGILCNPKLFPDAQTDTQQLCTTGLALFICQALSRALGCYGSWDREFALALSALATVADVCDLCSLNRALVKAGIAQMSSEEFRAQHVGLGALIKEAGVVQPGQRELQFQIIPRLNALGRLGSAAPGVQLLLTDHAPTAAQIASLSSGTNRLRQDIQKKIVASALLQAEDRIRNNPAAEMLILADENWHHGVVGPAASRVVEQTDRSAILLGLDDEGNWKGSGRAHTDHDLGSFVRFLHSAKMIASGGGHAAAVGVAVRPHQLERLKEACTSIAMPKRVAAPSFECLGELQDLAPYEWGRIVTLLEPFGPQNPRPLVRARDCRHVGPSQALKSRAGRIWAVRAQFSCSGRKFIVHARSDSTKLPDHNGHHCLIIEPICNSSRAEPEWWLHHVEL
ncbi:MAG TPA: DHH family phosphoesterase [Clostridia bacterium]|nr:DHH family phosphoesterase [Clostridia bacterium]